MQLKKTVLFHNTLLLLSYIISITVLEMLCLAKLIMDTGWRWGFDFLIILITLIILMGHYFFVRKICMRELISKVALLILILFDILISIAMIVFLIIPNDIIGKPIVSTHIFIVAIQVVILLARLCFLCIKRKNNNGLSAS